MSEALTARNVASMGRKVKVVVFKPDKRAK
jgi:hypothetical protein